MALLRQAPKVLCGTYSSGSAVELLNNPAYLQATRLRRRQLSRMTKAFDLATARQRLPDTEYAITRKVDGEFTCLVYEDGECVTLNPGGTLRCGAPFHDEAAAALRKAGIKRAMLGGELHVRRADGQRSRVHDVARAARAPETQADVDSLCLAVFNIYDLDGRDLSMNYQDALTRGQELLGQGDRVFPVESIIGNRQQALTQFDLWVAEQGDEGIVLRSDAAGIYKIKPRHSFDLAVLGYSEGIDERAGMLHSLLLGVVRDDTHAHVVCRVGGGFSDEQRVSLLQMFSEHGADSDYAEVNSERVAYRMIRPGTVVEISCLDVIARTSYGNPIDRMVLEWNSDRAEWRGVRRLPLCSILSPQFVALRDDKQFTKADAGLARIAELVDIPDSTRGQIDALNLPESKMLARAVATKTLKGATLVRKVLLWQTNKDSASRDYPAYVLYLTDYSPNRKDPLTREVCVSSSESQSRSLFEQWKQAAFKRGWKEVT